MVGSNNTVVCLRQGLCRNFCCACNSFGKKSLKFTYGNSCTPLDLSFRAAQTMTTIREAIQTTAATTMPTSAAVERPSEVDCFKTNKLYGHKRQKK